MNGQSTPTVSNKAGDKMSIANAVRLNVRLGVSKVMSRTCSSDAGCSWSLRTTTDCHPLPFLVFQSGTRYRNTTHFLVDPLG